MFTARAVSSRAMEIYRQHFSGTPAKDHMPFSKTRPIGTLHTTGLHINHISTSKHIRRPRFSTIRLSSTQFNSLLLAASAAILARPYIFLLLALTDLSPIHPRWPPPHPLREIVWDLSAHAERIPPGQVLLVLCAISRQRPFRTVPQLCLIGGLFPFH